MEDDALDQLHLVSVAHMCVMMATLMFILTRDGVLHLADGCFESEGLCSDSCCVIFQISQGLVEFAVAVFDRECGGG